MPGYIRLERKSLIKTNTLAYYTIMLFTIVKGLEFKAKGLLQYIMWAKPCLGLIAIIKLDWR